MWYLVMINRHSLAVFMLFKQSGIMSYSTLLNLFQGTMKVSLILLVTAVVYNYATPSRQTYPRNLSYLINALPHAEVDKSFGIWF